MVLVPNIHWQHHGHIKIFSSTGTAGYVEHEEFAFSESCLTEGETSEVVLESQTKKHLYEIHCSLRGT